jgi:hypothetical protein
MSDDLERLKRRKAAHQSSDRYVVKLKYLQGDPIPRALPKMVNLCEKILAVRAGDCSVEGMSANVSLSGRRIEHISGERRIKALFVRTYIYNIQVAQACDQICEMQDSAIGSTHSRQTNSPTNGSSPSQ